jgi:hypothetical protein
VVSPYCDGSVSYCGRVRANVECNILEVDVEIYGNSRNILRIQDRAQEWTKITANTRQPCVSAVYGQSDSENVRPFVRSAGFGSYGEMNELADAAT